MNPIESQTEILNELYNIMRVSAEDNYSTMRCRFDYSTSSDGSSSIGSEFSYVLDGDEKSAALKYPERMQLRNLVPKLYQEMKAHTGGEWTAFTLTVGEDGKATTRFEYPESDNA